MLCGAWANAESQPGVISKLVEVAGPEDCSGSDGSPSRQHEPFSGPFVPVQRSGLHYILPAQAEIGVRRIK